MESTLRKRKIFIAALPVFLALGVYLSFNDNPFLLVFTVAVGVGFFGRNIVLESGWYKTSNEQFKEGNNKFFPLVQLALFIVMMVGSILLGVVTAAIVMAVV